jgi:AraC-like DNA-binding protein
MPGRTFEVGAELLERAGAALHGNEKERVSIVVPPEMPGVELWRAEQSFRKWKVFHSVYSFCAVDPQWTGEARWRCRGRDFEITPTGHQLFEPGDSHHTFKIGGPPANFHVLFVSAPAMLAWTDPAAATTPPLAKGAIDDTGLWRIYQRLCRAMRGDASNLTRGTLLARYLRGLLARAGDRSGGGREHRVRDWRVPRVREIIHAHFTDDLSLLDLAAAVDLSPCRLERLFSANMPLPIHKYLTTVRLAKARELLANGHRPSRVVEMAGFSDLVQMGRAFRRYFGFTPSHYFSAWASGRGVSPS